MRQKRERDLLPVKPVSRYQRKQMIHAAEACSSSAMASAFLAALNKNKGRAPYSETHPSNTACRKADDTAARVQIGGAA